MMYQKLLGVILIGVISTSCVSRTQSTGYLVKYQEAEARYAAKDYYAALQLFKEALPLLRGKKEIVQAHFHQAYAYFYQKDYKLSARCFKNFYRIYPRVPQAEEALYMQGYVLYLTAPEMELDQTCTDESIKVLSNYLTKYLVGTYRVEASKYLKILKDKLAHKAFFNAQLYYKLSSYQAAVVALTNFQRDFPYSPNREKAAYIHVKAQYKIVKESKKEARESNLRAAIMTCQKFLDNYPESQYMKAVQGIYEAALVEMDKYKKLKMP
jgi:outer membrane protein assembly factor BamD